MRRRRVTLARKHNEGCSTLIKVVLLCYRGSSSGCPPMPQSSLSLSDKVVARAAFGGEHWSIVAHERQNKLTALGRPVNLTYR